MSDALDFQGLEADADLGAILQETLRRQKKAGRPDPVLPGLSLHVSGENGNRLTPGILGRIPINKPQRWVGYSVDFAPETGEVELALRYAPWPEAGPRSYGDALAGETIYVPNYGHQARAAKPTWTRRWLRMGLLEIELVRVLAVNDITVAFYSTQLPRGAKNA